MRDGQRRNRFLDDYPSRFEGYQHYLNQHPPRQEDHELRKGRYKPALAVNDPAYMQGSADVAGGTVSAVFWDTPDVSTEEAMAYMPTVLDTVALADLVVMSVTKDNYADHRAGLLRAMICSSGMAMLVVANKLEDGNPLLDDIKFKLADNGDEVCHVPAHCVYPLPHVKEDDEHERLRLLLSIGEAATLRSAVAKEVAGGVALKRKALAGAVKFLDRRFDDVLAPLRVEADIATYWADIVDRLAERDFYQRYRDDYLNAQEYGDFNLAVMKFLDMLELPGVGELISSTAKIARKPFQWVRKGLAAILNGNRPPPKPPEEEVVLSSYQRWLDSLKAEAQRQAEEVGHPAWAQLARQLDSNEFLMNHQERLAEAYIKHRETMTALIEAQAKALCTYLEANPSLRKVLQGTKFLTDLVVIISAVAAGGLDPTDLFIAPLVAPAMRLIMEAVGEQFMERQKRVLKDKQFAAIREVIDTFMVKPVQDLFKSSVSPQELATVRKDFTTVTHMALEVAGEVLS
jgi:hypothetical protein